MLFEVKHSDSNHYATVVIDNIVCVPHCHTSYEILFVTKGKIAANINGLEYIVSKGECVMISPMQIHSYRTIEDGTVKISIFSGDYIFDFYNETKGTELKNPITDFDLTDVCLLNKSSDRFEIKSILYKYCSKLIKNGIKKADKSNNDLSVKTVIYIQNNFKNNISLKQMAKDLGYSYNYLSSYFKNQFGCGYADYINKFRLEEAAAMLKRTDKSITQIAFESGFTSIRNFNVVFKKEYGINPMIYRNTLKNINS